ncbi:hypothetical protein [uncultured Thiodictyon sp.]|uniref:hypothetical protein n=1 Tax=uncultured Thiodictyon sp. TaxID=1846217 RepID=UPI0025CD51F3|nr:hypothetical protein [uncultured Thiodictyon sp.]
MTISQELEGKILRYFHVEKWPVGTIARQLGIHHGAVDRVLSQAGLPKLERPHRASLLDLKSAVLERQGDAIRFHPTLLALAAHYRFEPRPVAVARGNEKGRVERAIRYVREGFFAARTWRDLDDLNAQADAWCRGQAADRPVPRTAH